MPKFRGLLYSCHIGEAKGRPVHKLTRSLVWENGAVIVMVPRGFETDLASVPRLPIIYSLWGNRAHREAVLHDYLYRQGSFYFRDALAIEDVSKEDADWFFREAMIGQGRSWFLYHPMYLAVRSCGGGSFRSMGVTDRFSLDEKE